MAPRKDGATETIANTVTTLRPLLQAARQDAVIASKPEIRDWVLKTHAKAYKLNKETLRQICSILSPALDVAPQASTVIHNSATDSFSSSHTQLDASREQSTNPHNPTAGPVRLYTPASGLRADTDDTHADTLVWPEARKRRHSSVNDNGGMEEQRSNAISPLSRTSAELDDTYIPARFNWFPRMDKQLLPMLWDHPIPFVIPKKFAMRTNKEGFEAARPSPTAIHPGEATYMAPVPQPIGLPFDHHSPAPYAQAAGDADMSVVDIARDLYRFRRALDSQLLTGNVLQLEKQHSHQCRDMCIALVAKTVLHSSTLFNSVLPVYLEHGPEYDGIIGSCHYGLLLSSPTKGRMILPVQLKVMGPAKYTKAVRSRKGQQIHLRPRAWDDIPENNSIMTKFHESPLLRVNDIVLADLPKKLSPQDKLVWQPRRYATVWHIAPKLGDAVQVLLDHPRPYGPHHRLVCSPWSAHSTTLSITRTLHDTLVPVAFTTVLPHSPFNVVKVDDFAYLPRTPRFRCSTNRATEDSASTHTDRTAEDPEMEDFEENSDDGLDYGETSPAESGDIDDEDPRTLVNGRPSCRFRRDCSLFPRPDSLFCEVHHRVVAAVWLDWDAHEHPNDQRSTTYIHNREFDSQKDVKFYSPALADQPVFRKIRDMCNNYVVWQIDAEFGTIAGCQPVVYSLTVREFPSNKVVVSTTIDYGSMPLQKLHDMIVTRLAAKGSRRKGFHLVPYMRKQYRDNKTVRLSLASVGDCVREAGFSPDTHRVISWYSSLDIAIFNRALRGHSEVFDTTPFTTLAALEDARGINCLQPVNFCHALKRCSNLVSVRCGFVYRSIFPGKWLQMHNSDNDTLVANEILQYLLCEMEKWGL
ncbi:hypothetical protein HBH79_114170 [Parastagonospora nodorum]|nr:hypothetical protein HBI01_041630 [Parastagonospora nodorum]KAH4314392.1 hypothetical protein HBI02_069110 [Parastagonospora nodorum]KAH4472384.1 hypothetical protein HBH90_047270 [Parastagonospora nodorum]KAH4481498.1 hypothetical protein HBH89_248820 [Parastagonospora nodorum]KAH4485379.1 hypothetical protein HBH88_142340 [Parastagonospora nodorum]